MRSFGKKLVIFCVLVTLLMLPFKVAAAEQSITLTYKVANCDFDFYKVASFSVDTGYTLDDTFEEYRETVSALSDLESLSTEEMRTLSSTLDALIKRDNVPPTYSGKTDASGTLSIESVDSGLYLAVGENAYDEQYYYIPAPLFISVPTLLADSGELQYSVVIEHTKFEKDKIPDTGEYVDLKVIKIWNDDNNSVLRPHKIEAVLLRNGEIFDTVTLGADNNWCFVWEKLSREYNWTVAEKEIPEGYTMTVEKNNNTFVIRNTPTGEEPPSPPEDKLPQTGQLRWPVPVLALIGMTALTLGLINRKKSYCYKQK